MKKLFAIIFLMLMAFEVGCSAPAVKKTGGTIASSSAPAVKKLPLWPNGAPDNNGLSGAERKGGCVGNISTAMLFVYLPAKDRATGAAIVVTPGGGYGVVCMQSEGKEIADILLPLGIAAIVVKYRLPNGHNKVPANDARHAIRTARYHAAEWNIDPRRIGVWGFSAGGHLASTVATVFDNGKPGAKDPIEREGSRPDFAVLFYPVITMDKTCTHMGTRNNLLGPNAPDELVERYSNENRITAKTPPTFMLACTDDPVVPIENSIRFYRNLLKHKISAEFLIFERGGHGPNAFKSNPSWLAAFENWLHRRGCM